MSTNPKNQLLALAFGLGSFVSGYHLTKFLTPSAPAPVASDQKAYRGADLSFDKTRSANVDIIKSALNAVSSGLASGGDDEIDVADLAPVKRMVLEDPATGLALQDAIARLLRPVKSRTVNCIGNSNAQRVDLEYRYYVTSSKDRVTVSGLSVDNATGHSLKPRIIDCLIGEFRDKSFSVTSDEIAAKEKAPARAFPSAEIYNFDRVALAPGIAAR